MAELATYPFADFLADFDALDAAGAFARGPIERILGAALPHFRKKYPAMGDQVYRYSHFMMAMIYLAEHLEEFDQEDLAVYGSHRVGGLVGETLLRAVHCAFTGGSGIEASKDPDPQAILALARRLRPDSAPEPNGL